MSCKDKLFLISVIAICFLTSCTPRILEREEITETRKPDGSWSTTKTFHWKPAYGSHSHERQE